MFYMESGLQYRFQQIWDVFFHYVQICSYIKKVAFSQGQQIHQITFDSDISYHGHSLAEVGIPDYNLENVHDVDVIDYGVHNRSIRVVRTCAVDRHNHGDEDRAEEVGAFLGASEVAYHHACAFHVRDACDHMDLRLVPSSHHHRHRPRLFQLDSFHYVYLLPFRNTASLQQKVAVISVQRCALVPNHREKKFPSKFPYLPRCTNKTCH